MSLLNGLDYWLAGWLQVWPQRSYMKAMRTLVCSPLFFLKTSLVTPCCEPSFNRQNVTLQYNNTTRQQGNKATRQQGKFYWNFYSGCFYAALIFSHFIRM
jgi:hypothetical protein